MAAASEVKTGRTAERAAGTLVRAILVVGAMVLLVAADRAFQRMQVVSLSKFTLPTWGSWLESFGLMVLAGVAFGLAAMLPLRLRYRPLRALLLGIVPLLALIEYTLLAGPAQRFTATHARWFDVHAPLLNDLTSFAPYVLAVLLGVAIVAGFPAG
jgi:hypothetical protein